MKWKKWQKISLAVAICVVVLGVGVHFVTKIVTNTKQIHTPEGRIELNKSGKILDFEQILGMDNFGKIENVSISLEDCSSNSSFLRSNLCKEKSSYYADKTMIQELEDVFGEYQYYVLSNEAVIDVEERELFWVIRLDGSNGLTLNIKCYSTPSEDTVQIVFWEEDGYLFLKDDNWFEKNAEFGMYADAEVCDNILSVFEKYTTPMSLQEAEQIIAHYTEDMPLSAFLSYEHTFVKEVFEPTPVEEDYCIYREDLSDYDGYLQLYTLELYIGSPENGNEKYVYIFKIELYDNQDVLQKELYNDEENYGRDLRERKGN